MAAYAALTSLLHILNDIPNSPQLQLLHQKVNLLLDFLQSSSSTQNFESEICDAAYAAEDLIESHISYQLLLESQLQGEENCALQLCSSIRKMLTNLSQLFVTDNRRTISYESFDSIYSGGLDFEVRNVGELLQQSTISLDAKLVFVAQRCLWYCFIDFCPKSYYGEEDYKKYCRMITIHGDNAYEFFSEIGKGNKDLIWLTEGDRDWIQRKMVEVIAVTRIIRGVDYSECYYNSNEVRVFYDWVSAAWNMVLALRLRLLVPSEKDLLKTIDNFSSLVEKVLRINVDRTSDAQGHPFTGNVLPASSPSRLDSRIKERSIVVGFETDLTEIKTQLLRDCPEVKTVSIVGMGGIGKTTLAKEVFGDPYVEYHFDICAWETISQEYSVRKVLLGLLSSTERGLDEMHKESDERLAEYLYKSLKGRRYLIVMDDIWDVEVWDGVKRFFPDDNNGSRILLTTRLLDVAVYAKTLTVHKMRFLSKEESWSLLSQKVFAEGNCAPDLKEIGMEIVHSCGGLPLAIVVAGGLLSKVSRTNVCWRDVADNLVSLVAKDDEKCLEILSLSYNRLPPHLKACFLYMGVFPEDFEIPVVKLIHLWVAEGFLKPHVTKNLELVAEEYLVDLIERSLISVSTWSRNGKVKTCTIHDLLRELCVRNAEKENFFHVPDLNSGVTQDSIRNRRRLSIHPDVWYAEHSYYSIDSTSSRARSLLRFGLRYLMDIHLPFRLLRVLDLVMVYFSSFPREIIELVNLRYLALTYNGSLPPSILNFWNLQTIVQHSGRAPRHGLLLPIEIWMMPKLRHLCFTAACFPEFLDTKYFVRYSLLLENLQTLMAVRNFKCSKDVIRRIPNLKKLGISYTAPNATQWSLYTFENIVDLHQLEKLKLIVTTPRFDYLPHAEKLAFPLNLKSLTLKGCKIPWKYMTAIGVLPHLEVLKLRSNAFHGLEWQPIEGEFRRLKFLLIEKIHLMHWRADRVHFPSLQHLIIGSCSRIEIPSGVGDINTLQMIEFFNCGPSAVNSAKLIQQEQQDMGNESLEVRVESKPRSYYPKRSCILR